MLNINELFSNRLSETSLIDFINEDVYVGSSDKAIYSRLAQHKFNHISSSAQDKLKKKYPGIPGDRNQLMKWFKESNGKLVPNSEELIPRSQWNMLQQIGEIESSLMSPHKWTFFEFICHNPRPKKNKVLTVFECSNSKPYCQDQAKKWYLSRFRSFTDFACASYGIIPEEYSQLYPVREDEWAHTEESESMEFKYHLVSCNRGYEYIKAMDYDKVVVLFQNPQPEKFMHWMENMPNMKDKLIFVVTPNLVKKLKRKYPQFGNDGLLITRLVLLPDTHDAYMRSLKSCLDGEDLDRFKEIEKLIKDDDKSGQKKWVEETNKKFDIAPYLTDHPTWPVKISKSERNIHSETSDVVDSVVKEMTSWLKKWDEEQKKKDIDKKDIDYYKERLIFSPLDLLIAKYDLGPSNPKCLDIDKLYWNMMAALEKNAKDLKIRRVNPDKYHRYDYLWCYESVYDKLGKDDIIKLCDKIGLSQFDQNPLER